MSHTLVQTISNCGYITAKGLVAHYHKESYFLFSGATYIHNVAGGWQLKADRIEKITSDVAGELIKEAKCEKAKAEFSDLYKLRDLVF
jgi:hypothetical protein